jgi:glycosyltransferase involved in cell wall biosynthesis
MPHEFAIEAVRRSLFTVAPSLWAEPFGLVALEAAAAGKAIMASNTGGLADIVVHEKTGLLVDPSDSQAMRQGLRRLIDSSELRESLGQAAREHARLCFSADTIVPQFETAYESAIASRTLLVR